MPSAEVSTRDLRQNLAEIGNEVVTRGEIRYVTSRGRRMYALVPLAMAEAIDPDHAAASSSSGSAGK